MYRAPPPPFTQPSIPLTLSRSVQQHQAGEDSSYKDQVESGGDSIARHFSICQTSKSRKKTKNKPPPPSTNLASELFISVTCDGRAGEGERKEASNVGELNEYSKHKLSTGS